MGLNPGAVPGPLRVSEIHAISEVSSLKAPCYLAPNEFLPTEFRSNSSYNSLLTNRNMNVARGKKG